jgi:hypothetical protein
MSHPDLCGEARRSQRLVQSSVAGEVAYGGNHKVVFAANSMVLSSSKPLEQPVITAKCRLISVPCAKAHHNPHCAPFDCLVTPQTTTCLPKQQCRVEHKLFGLWMLTL